PLTPTRFPYTTLFRSGVDIEFGHKGARTVAVGQANLEIHSGEFVCLLGPSGCGKSTLLNAIAGFVTPTRGQLSVDGKAVTEPGPDRKSTRLNSSHVKI